MSDLYIHDADSDVRMILYVVAGNELVYVGNIHSWKRRRETESRKAEFAIYLYLLFFHCFCGDLHKWDLVVCTNIGVRVCSGVQIHYSPFTHYIKRPRFQNNHQFWFVQRQNHSKILFAICTCFCTKIKNRSVLISIIRKCRRLRWVWPQSFHVNL